MTAQPERDRVGLVDHPGGEDERDEPQDRTENEARDQLGRAMPARVARSAARRAVARRLVWALHLARGDQADGGYPSRCRGETVSRRAVRRDRSRTSRRCRAAKAAMPAAPQCHDGSARSRGRPRCGSRTRTPRGGRDARRRGAPPAPTARPRGSASGSRPAPARSSRTQPIPAAPLSSPTWTAGGIAGALATRRRRPGRASATPPPGGRLRSIRASPVARAARRLTQAMPAAPSSNPDALDGSSLASGQRSPPERSATACRSPSPAAGAR